ncbi:MAG: hypothetical protein KDA85_15385, partial [Planctomycetaceae bacterium]|nr:hypothetical protein [Planctomycetaceae bacterium]
MAEVAGILRMPVQKSNASYFLKRAESLCGLPEHNADLLLQSTPLVVPSVLPVYESDGKRFSEIWHRGEKIVMDFVEPMGADPGSFLGSNGGFSALSEVQALVPSEPSEDELLLQYVAQAARHVLENPSKGVVDRLKEAEAAVASQNLSANQGGKAAPSGSSPSAGGPDAQAAPPGAANSSSGAYEWPLSPVQQYLLSQGLAAALGAALSGAEFKNIWNNALRNSLGNLPGLGMFFASQWVGKQVASMFDSWHVDDESSTAEHAAKMIAQLLAAEIQKAIMSYISSNLLPAITGGLIPGGSSPGLLKKLDTFFNGLSSSATLGACHQGFFDDKGNVVTATAHPDVLVNGAVAAAGLSGDRVDPPAKMILDGSMTVHLGSDMFARVSSVTEFPSCIMSPGPCNVLVGGASPSSTATSAAEAALAAGQSLAQAAKKMRNVTAAGEAARQHALAAGQSESEAALAGAAAEQQAANVSQDVSPLVQAQLAELP